MFLRRLLLVILAVGALFLPLGAQPSSQVPAQYSAERLECIVYVTRTGIRYHYGWCRYLRLSKIPMKRSKAIGEGYTPCRVCGGSDCD